MPNEEENHPSRDSAKPEKKEPEEKPVLEKPSKKKWTLAPRTGQRHANPFARKTR